MPIALGIFKLSAEMSKQKGKLQIWGNEGITQIPASLPRLDLEVNALMNIAAARLKKNKEGHTFRDAFAQNKASH